MSDTNNRPAWLYKAFITVGLAIAVGGGGLFLYRALSGDSGAPGQAAGATLYTCPMHPQIIRDEPGACPICGMDLVQMDPPEEPETEEGMAIDTREDRRLVRVEPAMIQKMGLTTDIVRRQTIAREIRTVAHIDFNETGETVINSRVNGWVEKLYARYTGQSVQRGQALAGIYSPELVATQEEYLQLYKQSQQIGDSPAAADVHGLLDAARKRLRFWNISEAQIRAIEESGQASRLLTLHSPYSGVVVEKHINEGARISEGMDLFRIVDLSTVWAYAHIPEKDIPFVSVGQQVTLRSTQLPGEEFSGTVSFIFPYIDENDRDLKVRITFPNPGHQIKPGMFATVDIRETLPDTHIVIPSSAIIYTGERAITFVYLGDGLFEPREIITGIDAGDDRIQVIAGLEEDEAIVLSGQFLLDSESRIQAALQSMRSGSREGSDTMEHEH